MNFAIACAIFVNLDLSQHSLDWDFWPRQVKKWHFDFPESLSISKTDNSTVLILDNIFSSLKGDCRDVGFWTVETFWRVEVSFFERSRLKVSIKTMLRLLDIDCSWLSRPPSLNICYLWDCHFPKWHLCDYQICQTCSHGVKLDWVNLNIDYWQRPMVCTQGGIG